MFAKLLQTVLIAGMTAGAVVPAAQAQAFNGSGYWVVLATLPEEVPDPQLKAVWAKAKACGFEPFNDFTTKFDTFSPGYTAVVIWSAFSTKAKAQKALAAVKPCVPDAFIKKANYAGE